MAKKKATVTKEEKEEKESTTNNNQKERKPSMLEGISSGMKSSELPFGKYICQVLDPGDKGWTTRTFVEGYKPDEYSPDAQADEDNTVYKFVNFRLGVVEPEELEGRLIFHGVIYGAGPAAGELSWDPASMIQQFLIGLGVAENRREGGKGAPMFYIKEPFQDENGSIDLYKCIGRLVKVEYDQAKKPDKKTGEYRIGIQRVEQVKEEHQPPVPVF